MGKIFVPYELAVKLKTLGFDEPCFGWYENNELVTLLDCTYPEDRIEFIKVGEISKRISAPTFSQAFRWFREKYGLSGWVNEAFRGDSRQGIVSIKSEIGLDYRVGVTKIFEEYEDAELACLEKLIEITKK